MNAPAPATRILKGSGVSAGIGIGRILLLPEPGLTEASRARTSDPLAELNRYRRAHDTVRDRVRQSALHLGRDLGAAGGILEVHVMLLEDPALGQEVERLVGSGKTAEFAVDAVFGEMAARLKAAANRYLRDRYAVFEHIRLQLIMELCGSHRLDGLSEQGDVILVARELTPFALVNLPENVKGVALESGGANSHVAILARALSLPMVLGLTAKPREAEDGSPAVINGDTGDLIVHPSPEVLEEHRALLRRARSGYAKDLESAGQPAVTRDGRRLEVLANIGTLEDLNGIGRSGADGVGLFRTEFLFLHRETPPGEAEQFEAFKRAAAALAPRKVVIRTVDFGGDKHAPFLTGSDKGPSAGLRGIRLCLENPAFFRTHLRAILRAGAFGRFEVMFPMVPGLETFRKARAMVNSVAAELARDPAHGAKSMPVGTMVEVPSAALMAGALAREADFFSVGTNDLLQYALGVDRSDGSLFNNGTFLPPSVIHLLSLVVDSAHKNGRKATVCGEIAGDPNVIPLLVGLGFDGLSMEVSRIPAAKRLIRAVLHSECRSLAERVLRLETPSEVREMLAKTGLSLL